MDKLLYGLLFTFLVILGVSYMVFSYGYVFTQLYSWFIIPVFPSAPVFTITQAYGFMFLFNFIHIPKISFSEDLNDKSKSDTDRYTAICSFLARPWFCLFVGKLLTYFL